MGFGAIGHQEANVHIDANWAAERATDGNM